RLSSTLSLQTDAAPPDIYTLSLHDALPIYLGQGARRRRRSHPLQHGQGLDGQPHLPIPDRHLQKGACARSRRMRLFVSADRELRSEEHTSELQSRRDLVCRLLLEKKKK